MTDKGKKDALAALGFTAAEVAFIRTLRWRMTLHMSAESGNTAVYDMPALGVTKTVFTPKSHAHKDDYMGTFGTPRVTYTVADAPEQFALILDALRCIRERFYDRFTGAMKEVA